MVSKNFYLCNLISGDPDSIHESSTIDRYSFGKFNVSSLVSSLVSTITSVKPAWLNGIYLFRYVNSSIQENL